MLCCHVFIHKCINITWKQYWKFQCEIWFFSHRIEDEAWAKGDDDFTYRILLKIRLFCLGNEYNQFRIHSHCYSCKLVMSLNRCERRIIEGSYFASALAFDEWFRRMEIVIGYGRKKRMEQLIHDQINIYMKCLFRNGN